MKDNKSNNNQSYNRSADQVFESWRGEFLASVELNRP